MKLRDSKRVGREVACAPGRLRAGPSSGFTMIEIAIALAVIGFALVAIIGVLPQGMSVQKENREETIINQDATVFLNAIRNGAQGLDDLTNYVRAITNRWVEFQVTSTQTNVVGSGVDGYTYASSSVASRTVQSAFRLNNGQRIVGLLSMPRLTAAPTADHFHSNRVEAYFRAMSGPALDKAPQKNANVLDMAFAYRLLADVGPVPMVETNDIYRRTYETNLHEIRLAFRWPLLPGGLLGNGRHSFRTITGGRYSGTNDLGQPLYFLQSPFYIAAH
jgi:prepilin-type N-terminal cleavage/methylation domain-containing protein